MSVKIFRQVVITVSVVLLICLLVFYFYRYQDKKISLSIGYQSITAQTWGAIIIKQKKLLEQNCSGVNNLEVKWSNFASGPPITSNMLAGKLNIGFMGDMPMLVNGDLGQTNSNYESGLAAFDGKGVGGINQDIIVLLNSNIKILSDLKGKTISVPNSSSSHRKLLQEISAAGLKSNDVKIVFQDIPTGIALLEKGDVDALSTWEPYPTYLVQEKGMRTLPRTDNSKYLAGVVVDKKWVELHSDLYACFLEALDEAHVILSAGSEDTISLLSKETGFSFQVVKQVISNVKWESQVLPEDVHALVEDVKFLKSVGKISDNFNVNEFVENKK